MLNSFWSLRFCSWSRMWPIVGFIGIGTLFLPKRCVDSVSYPCYMQHFLWLICKGNGLSLLQTFLFDVRILDPMRIFQSLYHFGRVLSRAEFNLFGNSIWLNESMVICLSNFVTCSKLLALLQRQVRRADSDSTAYGTEQSSLPCLQLIHHCSII